MSKFFNPQIRLEYLIAVVITVLGFVYGIKYSLAEVHTYKADREEVRVLAIRVDNVEGMVSRGNERVQATLKEMRGEIREDFNRLSDQIAKKADK